LLVLLPDIIEADLKLTFDMNIYFSYSFLYPAVCNGHEYTMTFNTSRYNATSPFPVQIVPIDVLEADTYLIDTLQFTL